jgi:hypothetical protein
MYKSKNRLRPLRTKSAMTACVYFNTPVRLDRLTSWYFSPSGCWSLTSTWRSRPRALPLSRLVRVANGSSRALRGAGFALPKHLESTTDGTGRVLQSPDLSAGKKLNIASNEVMLLSSACTLPRSTGSTLLLPPGRRKGVCVIFDR